MTKTMIVRTALVGAAALGLSLAAPATGAAQAPAQPQQSPAGKPTPANVRQDLEKLHASNQAEIQTGKMAEERAQSADVKQLGTTMDQQHSQLDQDLQSLAQKRGINLEGPAYQKELKKLQTNAQAKLGDKQGQAFDRAYSSLMVQEHTQDVTRTVPKAIADAQKAGDTEVASMLTSVKTTLEQHLTMARQAQAAVGKQAAGAAGQGAGGMGGAGTSSGGSGSQP